MALKKNSGRAFAVLLAFSAPLALAQDVPAQNPEGTISISGTVEGASADELAISRAREATSSR
jgi:predicted outer membrane protein